MKIIEQNKLYKFTKIKGDVLGNIYRQVDERKELINDYVVKKMKATDQMQSNWQEKIQLTGKPELLGKNIYHKWVKEEGEEWNKGHCVESN